MIVFSVKGSNCLISFNCSVVCCLAMAEDVCWSMMPVHQLADLLRQGIEKVLFISEYMFYIDKNNV